MEEGYIEVLIQSLKKKREILDDISSENKLQEELLHQDELDMDAFHRIIEEKEKLIDEISFLDDGFNEMYQKIKEELSADRENYKEKIRLLQQLITEITEKSAKIQREEMNNRRLTESQLSGMREKVRNAKASNQVTDKYYKSMSKLNYIEPQFMDKKK